MIERIKYNFWLLLFIGNLLVFLFFLYQAFSFTSVYAYRWVFFLSTPVFTSGIHLLIKSRSPRAEWLSVINFLLIAMLIVYFNAIPTAVKMHWALFTLPVFNQLAINSFDVLWNGIYRYKWYALIAICLSWVLTCGSVVLNAQSLSPWVIGITGITGLGSLGLVVLNETLWKPSKSAKADEA